MRVLVQLALALMLSLAASARAAEPDAPSPKRAVPDYGGQPATRDDAALWVPRVLLAPAYAVAEYGLRRPLGWLVSTIDEQHVLGAGGSTGLGILPSFRVDVGRQSTIGVLLSLEHAPFASNELLAKAAFGGIDWFEVGVADRVHLDVATTLELFGQGARKSDGLFYGLGPRARDDARALYASDTADAHLMARRHDGRLDALYAYVRVHAARFADDPCCGPSLLEREAQGRLEKPPGFGGYTSLAEGVGLAIDSRVGPWRESTGVRLELSGEHAVDLEAPLSSRWVRYGGKLAGFIDVTGDRVLGLTLDARFADPLGRAAVPFTELASLGGDGPLPGFLEDRVLDRSVAAATASYTWPIWVFLEGTAHVGVGNAFGPHLGDLEPRLFRLSFGGGFRTRGEHAEDLEVLLAAGSDPFADGARVRSARFVLSLVPRIRPAR